MLDDAELFLQICQKQGILVEQEIIEAFKTSCSTGELQLAHTSIIASLCKIIGQVLSSSPIIKLVNLSDCMLIPKGSSYILKALFEGSSVSSLYLKGNNINGPLVEQLGEMLIHNNTLKIIHIEWNNLGSQIDCFYKFCDGLAKNNCLEELDLRYNQISTNCADPLVKVLTRNKNLKKLDLAWNSLGTNGGKKILQGIQTNRVLLSLNLKGNCIPNDIHSAITEQIIENKKRRILCETPIVLKENICSVSVSSEDDGVFQIKSRIQTKKKWKERPTTSIEELNNIASENSRNDDKNGSKNKTLIRISKNTDTGNYNFTEIDEKMEALNNILQDRSATIDHLRSDLESKTTALKLIHTENEEIKSELERVKDENSNIREEKTTDIENLKKVHMKLEKNWKESYKDLEETYESNLKQKQEIDAKNRAYEKELRKATLEIQSIKDKLSSTIQNYEDTISECKTDVHRIKREIQEKENRYKIEINTLKETLKESTEALEKCQEHLQKLRNEFRETVESQSKLKMKADENERFAAKTMKIEEALHKSKEEREKLEEKLQESRKSIAYLQKQVIKLQEESIEPQKRYEALKMELQLEKERSCNLKSELQDQTARIREQNDQVQKMLSQVNGLYAQISEAQINHVESLRVKETEIEKLKNVIMQKTRELDDFKSEQVQRAHQFQAAISKFVGSVV
ncbi:PREDICTED: leucine-rich repeat-containing protein 45-like [Ceratosolen solmsi marchali]|uniref:Leucine-rich repeat-containing protein 45-like n=1 Tax=Ceratosolen solmsi marchali TaxID=326594 RepID=A0AAJ7DVV8_9HYME|nr:PREDICTED: leucine-rich repeat-containing protein 45-like [Ceratosolen solmsi marchali]